MPLLAPAFTNRDAWQRSRRGNLWRTYDHEGRTLTLTIFRRSDERYGWCIADADGPAYSRKSFTTERQAIRDLATCLGI